jgi:uroporphyrinogen-III synthase
MSDPTIIITRPVTQTHRLAESLREAQRQVVLFPCMEIEALSDYRALDEVLAHLHEFALVAFVSPNAIAATMQRLQQLQYAWPKKLAMAVMGRGSKEALLGLGFDEIAYNIIHPLSQDRTDSETLLEVLDLETLRTQKVLIIRGETGRELLADALRTNGIEVQQIAAYRRCVPAFSVEKQREFVRLLELDGDWVVTSSEILQTILNWAASAGGLACVAKMQQQHLLVPHRRIAENARLLGFQSLTLASSGDEHMFVALQSRL